MRVFKTKGFARFARKERIEDDALCEAVRRAEQGLIDADLGGGVVKQRVARPGQGRSGGYRTIILYRLQERSVFVDGFAKSEKDNIGADDLDLFRELAREFLSYGDSQVRRLITTRAWIEVMCDA